MTEEQIRKAYLGFREDNPIRYYSIEAQFLEFGKVCAIEATKELQEENARGNWFGKVVTKDRRLTEAKEIITNILKYFPDYKAKTFDDMSLLNALAKAEAFLKE